MIVYMLQDSKKDTEVYNGLLDSEGEGEGGMIWENGIVATLLFSVSHSAFLRRLWICSVEFNTRLHILLVLLYVLFQSIRMDFPNQLY